MLPLPYGLPGYGFIFLVFAGIMLRDRWLAVAAASFVSDTVLCHWMGDHPRVIEPECLWAYEAIVDLGVATFLAWSMSVRGIVMGAALGVNVFFYLVIGASQAFGSTYVQEYVAYHAWWGMEYLAFALVGLLAIIGIDDHGGKLAQTGIARYFSRPRRAVLEGNNPNRKAPSRQAEYERIETSPLIQRIKNGE